jgi:hypothetical protein
MRRIWTALLAPLLLASTALARPNYAPGSLDYYFRLEWQVAPAARARCSKVLSTTSPA